MIKSALTQEWTCIYYLETATAHKHTADAEERDLL